MIFTSVLRRRWRHHRGIRTIKDKGYAAATFSCQSVKYFTFAVSRLGLRWWEADAVGLR